MTTASYETFLLQINRGKTSTDKAKIFNYIKRYPCCHKNNIIDSLEMTHQTVTARLSGLLDLGVIRVSSELLSSKSCLSKFVVQEDAEFILISQEQRKIQKFEQWKAKGLRDFQELISNETRARLSA
mgnify:CR=1 FL=1